VRGNIKGAFDLYKEIVTGYKKKKEDNGTPWGQCGVNDIRK
jgi:hypothetical protein